jgi:hypothetical protein
LETRDGSSGFPFGWQNGSRLVVVPASPGTIRGYAADLLCVDEAAFIDDDLFTAIWPMLAVTEG